MSERPVAPVEDFTRAFMVTGFLAIFALLFFVWAAWGYASALLVAGAAWAVLRICEG